MSDLVTMHEAAEMLRISRPSIYRLLNAPAMPKTVRVSPRKQMFRRTDIEKFIAQGGLDGADR